MVRFHVKWVGDQEVAKGGGLVVRFVVCTVGVLVGGGVLGWWSFWKFKFGPPHLP